MHKNFIKITAVFVQSAHKNSFVKLHKKARLAHKKLVKLHKGTALVEYGKAVKICKIEGKLK